MRGNVAHRPARTHRGRSPFRFVELPKQVNEKVTLMAKSGSHIDGRSELGHRHHIYTLPDLYCRANDGQRGDARIADINRS
jgi:hypothetical protein